MKFYLPHKINLRCINVHKKLRNSSGNLMRRRTKKGFARLVINLLQPLLQFTSMYPGLINDNHVLHVRYMIQYNIWRYNKQTKMKETMTSILYEGAYIKEEKSR